MGNAAIAYTNLADAGTVSASSQEILLPVSRVLNPHIEQRWRAQETPAYLIVDLGSQQSVDTIGVFGISAAGGTVRARMSTADSSAEDGDAIDSGTLSDGNKRYDTNYDSFIYLGVTPATGRYVRIDIADPSGSYVEAGRIFIGLRTEFSFNFSPGSQKAWVDRSATQETRGGQTIVWNDNTYRTGDFNFDAVSEAQRNGMIETIDRVNGRHTDILFIGDVGSDNLPRDSIWGLVRDQTPAVYTAVPDIFTKQYRIKERL